jgi:hypothetical protein
MADSFAGDGRSAFGARRSPFGGAESLGQPGYDGCGYQVVEGLFLFGEGCH